MGAGGGRKTAFCPQGAPGEGPLCGLAIGASVTNPPRLEAPTGSRGPAQQACARCSSL